MKAAKPAYSVSLATNPSPTRARSYPLNINPNPTRSISGPVGLGSGSRPLAGSHGYVFYVYLHFDLNENSVSVWCGWHRTAYAVCVQRIFSKMRRRGGDELLNKVVIFDFFGYKKYSRSFITLWLNHWWQMGYFSDVFHTFLALTVLIVWPSQASRFSSKIS